MDSGALLSHSHAVKGETVSSSASASVAATLGTATVAIVQAGRVHASGISSNVVADSNAPAAAPDVCVSARSRLHE
jgi:hypothetical protein